MQNSKFTLIYLLLVRFLRNYFQFFKTVPVGIYLLKFINRNTRIKCEICSKLTIKTPEQRQASFRSGLFIVNFEPISHLVLSVSIVNFEHVNADWGTTTVSLSVFSFPQFQRQLFLKKITFCAVDTLPIKSAL